MRPKSLRTNGVLIALIGLACLFCACGGCRQAAPAIEPAARLGTSVALGAGVITKREAEAIQRSAHAVAKTFEDITEEQEYYIGRAVAATLLSRYKPFADSEANWYLNVLGQTLAAASRRPETFGGYHFLILDTNEVNAFAAPGGFILVTRGMISLCKSEGALAAVLAHEIGHVEGKHGLRAIRRGRLTRALTIIAAEAGKTYGTKELAQLTELFEGAVGDITKTLIVNGYSRSLEREADRAAVRILTTVGYNPRSLQAMLQEMGRRYRRGGAGFFRTHPAPADRLADIRPLVARWPATRTTPARRRRFEQFAARLQSG